MKSGATNTELKNQVTESTAEDSTNSGLASTKQKTTTFLNWLFCILVIIFNFIPYGFYAVSNWTHQPGGMFYCCMVANILTAFFLLLFTKRNGNHALYGATAAPVFIAALLLYTAFPKLITAAPFLIIETLFLAAVFAFSVIVFRKLSLLSNTILTLILLLLAALQHLLKTPFNATVAGEILKPATSDILNLITFYNLAILAGVLLIAVLLSCIILKASRTDSRKKLFVVASILLAFSLTHFIPRPELFCSMPKSAYNLGLRGAIRAAVMGIGYKNKYKILIDDLPPLDKAPLKINTLQGNEGCVFILHLGEALSADHTSLNGYTRNTTPFLSSCEALIHYPSCLSSAPLTANAHVALLTDGQGNCAEQISPELMPRCGSFLEALTHCHFKLFLMETDGEPDEIEAGGLDYAVIKLHPHADFSYATRNQSKQRENITKILQQAGHENICICLNNDGSHWSFYNYNKETAPFNPADENAYFRRPDLNPGEAEKVINAYDNTIFDTDLFIKEIIEELKGKPFLYVYVSDHGENVSDEDGWVRETDMEKFFKLSSCKVPFFFIASEEFLHLNPHFKDALEQLKKNTDLTVSHAHLFHTILGIFGIQTPYYNEGLDLSSDKALPYTGPHPSRGGKAADEKKWY